MCFIIYFKKERNDFLNKNNKENDLNPDMLENVSGGDLIRIRDNNEFEKAALEKLGYRVLKLSTGEYYYEKRCK